MRRCRKRPGIGRTQGSPPTEAAKQNSNKNTPTGHFSCCFVVIPVGVEPTIFWMRTRRPGPLDDGTTCT